jgi:hypothetical protein
MISIARAFARGFLPLLLMALTHGAFAEDAKSLAIGAPIKDGALTIGSRTWTLPPGDWKLAGRNVREVKLTEIRTGAEVIEVYSALVRDGKLRAGLMMTGPTGGTRVPSWREDPACRNPGGLYREDTSTATLSDCMVIRVFPAHPVKVPGAEVYESVATWMQSAGVATPRPVINVLIVKYQGDEYFRASTWFDPAEFGLKGEELGALTAAPESLLQWARAYRAAVAKAMGSTSGTFVVPPLPAAR